MRGIDLSDPAVIAQSAGYAAGVKGGRKKNPYAELISDGDLAAGVPPPQESSAWEMGWGQGCFHRMTYGVVGLVI